MTGNTILLALGLGGRHNGDPLASAVAIAAFVGGSFAGAAIATKGARAPLVAELIVLVAFVVVWYAVQPQEAFQLPALALAAVAMGLQQAATQKLHPQPTISTTYQSGTVERVGEGLFAAFKGEPNELVFNVSVWLVYLISGFLVAFASVHDGAILGAVPVAVVFAVFVCLRFLP